MNTKWYILAAFIFVLPSILNAQIGCMDNSWHLQKKYDNKEYHYVSCTCPCRDKIMHRNQCTYCQHYHDSEQWSILPDKPQKTARKENLHLLLTKQNVAIAMKKLITQYKKTH